MQRPLCVTGLDGPERREDARMHLSACFRGKRVSRLAHGGPMTPLPWRRTCSHFFRHAGILPASRPLRAGRPRSQGDAVPQNVNSYCRTTTPDPSARRSLLSERVGMRYTEVTIKHYSCAARHWNYRAVVTSGMCGNTFRSLFFFNEFSDVVLLMCAREGLGG